MEKSAEECATNPSPAEPQPTTSLFPLFPSAPPPSTTTTTTTTTTLPQWLCNSSFTTNLSSVKDTIRSDLQNPNISIGSQSDHEEDEEEVNNERPQQAKRNYELLESSESERESKLERKRRKRKRKKKKRSDEEGGSGYGGDYMMRKPGVRDWANSDTRSSKDYYFDSSGDRDNLAFGCLYRMDVANYKASNPPGVFGLDFQGSYRWDLRGSILDGDGDIDSLDGKLKSSGRYWSAKYAALERHKNFKRIRIVRPKISTVVVPRDFISIGDIPNSHEDIDGSSVAKTSTVEESWDDEVLRKTREFNKMTREQPHNEKVWLDFSLFQDRVANMQPQKGARLQTLEKKISILEKAVELNPENEELLLALLKAYQSRDSTDVLIQRWEKMLMKHSGSYKLWREFLHVLQGDFSRFKISDMRKMYGHAIQALSSACTQQFRQVVPTDKHLSQDPAVVQQELGLVDIFLSLCRFEWQAGYQELATALFQAEIEFSLFYPSLLLTEQSKQRLFQHFWNSDGARVGEEGALGWSTWLEKAEENRQRSIDEEMLHDNEGGWTGWSEPLSKLQETIGNLEKLSDGDVADDAVEGEIECEDIKQEDDTETMLKLLGINLNADASGEVKDTSTWMRWSEEESSRDCDQWMPVRAKSAGLSENDGTPDKEVDEQLSRVILYEDISEYLFSLSSGEARLSLVLQFIDFFGGKISQWICTNSSSWAEKTLSLDALPDSILQTLERIHNILTKMQSSSAGCTLELLLGSSNDIARRISMMKFLRNATLLCFTAFPRNYILEEAAFIAEELSVTNLNSCSSSITPCRSLAKGLLKSDRQDLLLCGVYARREAAFGNIDHARRVFDMALTSVEGLPLDLQSNAPLLYFWYAEAELARSPGNGPESSYRAIYILSCLGSGVKYTPYKCQPSSLQLLRAHQGFRDRIKTVRPAWGHGVIDDQSIALICAAALFEELTTGWSTGCEILHQAFTMVLPERRSQSYQFEFLFNYYVKMLQRHHKECGLSKVWDTITQGLQIYPFSTELFSTLVEISHLYTSPNKVRLIFDEYCLKKPSLIVWLFALSFEMAKGSQHRIHGLFEKALTNDRLHNSVVIWRFYLAYEMYLNNPSAARRIFFRAIHACPWSKRLWLDGFLKLHTILTVKELSDLQEVMRDKELNLRTDIYEILLQEEFV